jgi:hypothetical protein
MAKQDHTLATHPPAIAPPRIYKALFGTGGDIIRGQEITEVEAIAERKAGFDVVVCGLRMMDNRDLAEKIERAANGKCKPCPPHVAMGPGAMYHFQPDPRPPDGHCFYETSKRKSKKATKP